MPTKKHTNHNHNHNEVHVHIGDKKKKAGKRRRKARAQYAQQTQYTQVTNIPAPPPPPVYTNRPQFFDPTTQAERERHPIAHPLFANVHRGNQPTFLDQLGRDPPISIAAEVQPYQEGGFSGNTPLAKNTHNTTGNAADQPWRGSFDATLAASANTFRWEDTGDEIPPYGGNSATPPGNVSAASTPARSAGVFENLYGSTSANTSAFQDTNPMSAPIEHDTLHKFGSEREWNNYINIQRLQQDQAAQIEKVRRAADIASVIGSGGGPRPKRASDDAYNERRRSARLAEKAAKAGTKTER